MNKIIVDREKIEGRLDEVDQWLRKNAGQGSARYGGQRGTINHWLNGDDWLYYDLYNMSEEDEIGMANVESATTVFVFRSESVAVEFALRFA
ncbi:hypothetical protein UFOVP257_200 [uncultured Caudovirales phage]|uniref:Uncharacterized protein n=1 Tax=uncultured Caudovirales phage TaxID=2100421 RepID=A0A6J5LJE4_9CAUD|nr:hypothetical protein UFOVP257_200 [uncultured Caudovirales phage]